MRLVLPFLFLLSTLLFVLSPTAVHSATDKINTDEPLVIPPHLKHLEGSDPDWIRREIRKDQVRRSPSFELNSDNKPPSGQIEYALLLAPFGCGLKDYPGLRDVRTQNKQH